MRDSRMHLKQLKPRASKKLFYATLCKPAQVSAIKQPFIQDGPTTAHQRHQYSPMLHVWDARQNVTAGMQQTFVMEQNTPWVFKVLQHSPYTKQSTPGINPL